jgi:hypothetical protein
MTPLACGPHAAAAIGTAPRQTHHCNFAHSAGLALEDAITPMLVHPSAFAADERLIRFNVTGELIPRIVVHRESNAMQHDGVLLGEFPQKRHLRTATGGAGDGATVPSKLDHFPQTVLRIREVNNGLLQSLWCSHETSSMEAAHLSQETYYRVQPRPFRIPENPKVSD